MPASLIAESCSGLETDRLADFLLSTVDASETGKLFLGRAGELFVASHLLRRGLNATPLLIDTGVDLLAQKELRFEKPMLQAEYELYQFQIKTTSTNEYRISLPVKKVHELWHRSINLVVVFWANEMAASAVVLPPRLIRMLTSGGFEDPKAPLVMICDNVSLRFIKSGHRYFIRNRNNEITTMLNRFDRIEPIGVDTVSLPEYAIWSDGKGLVELEPGG